MIIYARYIELAFVSFCSAVIMVSLLRNYYFENTINCLCLSTNRCTAVFSTMQCFFLQFVSEYVTLNIAHQHYIRVYRTPNIRRCIR